MPSDQTKRVVEAAVEQRGAAQGMCLGRVQRARGFELRNLSQGVAARFRWRQARQEEVRQDVLEIVVAAWDFLEFALDAQGARAVRDLFLEQLAGMGELPGELTRLGKALGENRMDLADSFSPQ